MIMLSWITKIKLELMAYEAMFATTSSATWMPCHLPHGCHIIATRGPIRSQYRPSARCHVSVQHGTELRQQPVWHRATSATSMDGATWRSLSWRHMDQSDHDIWIIRSRHVIVLVHVATSASSVASSHVSYQHARRHVVVTFMMKLVTMFSSNRRRVVTWRKRVRYSKGAVL
jgi:hypothetical protein